LKKEIKASGDSIERVIEVDLSLLTKPYWMVTCVFGSGRDGQEHGRCYGYFGGRQEFFPTFGP
jgi:hypothetical protein